MNDPCGAVFVPETKEYLFCYQWNPGTTDAGNSAWGMARSTDLVTWEDLPPAILNGSSYDSLGVFSGSIVSRIIEGRRVLFLFYTSVSALPIHWSKEYIEGCESQSVAFSTDFGRSWNRYENNPLLTVPPKQETTTGWRDPFVSRWQGLSKLLGQDISTEYMMVASGERSVGSELHLYQSSDLLDWKPVSTILSVEEGSRVSPDDVSSDLRFGMNFECASFFSIGEHHYIIVGIEDDDDSKRHNGHGLLWMCGDLVLKGGEPKFEIRSHGLLDHGVSYAAHIFRDEHGRILQLGWADENAPQNIVQEQGWAGCLVHPSELYEISRPIEKNRRDGHAWKIAEASGSMTTLGIRPAPQLSALRTNKEPSSFTSFSSLRSKNFELRGSFRQPGNEKFIFNVRSSDLERTQVIFDCKNDCITIDRCSSSAENIGPKSPDTGPLCLGSGEDLDICIFVDVSIVEVYANDRFAMTSRIYPSSEASVGVSYDFGGFDERNVKLEVWDGLRPAWPYRDEKITEAGQSERILEYHEASVIASKEPARATVVAV